MPPQDPCFEELVITEGNEDEPQPGPQGDCVAPRHRASAEGEAPRALRDQAASRGTTPHTLACPQPGLSPWGPERALRTGPLVLTVGSRQDGERRARRGGRGRSRYTPPGTVRGIMKTGMLLQWVAGNLSEVTGVKPQCPFKSIIQTFHLMQTVTQKPVDLAHIPHRDL